MSERRAVFWYKTGAMDTWLIQGHLQTQKGLRMPFLHADVVVEKMQQWEKVMEKTLESLGKTLGKTR